MKFWIDQAIFAQFDEAKLGLVVAEGVNNGLDDAGLRQMLGSQAQQTRQRLEGQVLVDVPEIAAWREAYRQFGSKPKDYPSSIESLCRRVTKGELLISINPLVDAYNYISLKYLLPVGGEDLDKMQGDLRLTVAGDHEEPVAVLGKSEPQVPYPGEVIYRDDVGTICRRWNWREADRTKLTPATTRVVMVVEALGATTVETLQTATEELQGLVSQFGGGKSRYFLLSKNSPEAELVVE